jgi:hypothetical protein
MFLYVLLVLNIVFAALNLAIGNYLTAGINACVALALFAILQTERGNVNE